MGFFGLSGNVLTRNDGAGIILGSVVTEAKLIPTEPIPAEQNYCDNCRLCKAGCASGFIDGDEKVTVTMGGLDFSYSKKRHHSRYTLSPQPSALITFSFRLSEAKPSFDPPLADYSIFSGSAVRF